MLVAHNSFESAVAKCLSACKACCIGLAKGEDASRIDHVCTTVVANKTDALKLVARSSNLPLSVNKRNEIEHWQLRLLTLT